jgi:hypothetical protein
MRKQDSPTGMGWAAASLVLALISGAMGGSSGAAARRTPTPRASPVWRTYRSTDGGFEVSMPGRARRTQQTVDSPDGKRLIQFHTAEVGGTSAFSVVTFDGPENFLRTPPEVVLKGSRDGILAKAEGKRVSERSLSLQGKPGRELVIAHPDGNKSWLRMYLVGRRLYQVTAVTTKRNDAQRFLSSFRLILRP